MKASLQFEVTKKGVATDRVAPGGFAAKASKRAMVHFFDRTADDGTSRAARKVVRLKKKSR